MKPYKKIYADAFGYDVDDHTSTVPSELSGNPAIDIHHIVDRSDRIENLMALTREEHQDFGEIKGFMYYLLKIHKRQLELHNIDFDEDWFLKWLDHYRPFAAELEEEYE